MSLTFTHTVCASGLSESIPSLSISMITSMMIRSTLKQLAGHSGICKNMYTSWRRKSWGSRPSRRLKEKKKRNKLKRRRKRRKQLRMSLKKLLYKLSGSVLTTLARTIVNVLKRTHWNKPWLSRKMSQLSATQTKEMHMRTSYSEEPFLRQLTFSSISKSHFWSWDYSTN